MSPHAPSCTLRCRAQCVRGYPAERPTLHFDQSDILDRAEDIGNGWRRTTLDLGQDDSAYSGVSTKWEFRGPGRVDYLIHPSGWQISTAGPITRLPR